MRLKLDAHGKRPVRFWVHASDFVTSRPFLMRLVWSAFEQEPVSILTHQTHCSDSLLLERRPYQTHQKRT